MRANLSFSRTPEFISYWVPPILFGFSILALSGDWGSAGHTLGLVKWLLSWLPFLSSDQIDLIHGYLRKAAHVLVYGTLYFLWFRAYQGHWRYSLQRAFFWSLGFCVLVAMLDEGHQALLASRTGCIADVALDSAGSTLGAMITLAFWTPRPPATPPRR
ncbi:MAG: VanZ family protein [Desulfobaccales bacterium]|nr:VanZ family protein [Desulfobaccales bacterium]